MKTLAMRKMAKNFHSVLEKKYPKEPYEKFSTIDLLERLEEEVKELRDAIIELDGENARNECADVSNIVDYIYQRLCKGRLR